MSEVSDNLVLEGVTPQLSNTETKSPLQILDSQFIANVIFEWEVTKRHFGHLKNEQKLADEILDQKIRGWALAAPVEDFLIYRDELPEDLRLAIDKNSKGIQSVIPRSITYHMNRTENAGDLEIVGKRLERVRQKELLNPETSKKTLQELTGELEKRILSQLKTDIHNSIADKDSSVAKVVEVYKQRGLLPSNFILDYKSLGPRVYSTPEVLEVFKNLSDQLSKELQQPFVYGEDGLKLMGILSEKIEDIRRNGLLNPDQTRQMLGYADFKIYIDLLKGTEKLIVGKEANNLGLDSQQFKDLAKEFYKNVNFATERDMLSPAKLVEVENRLAKDLDEKLTKSKGFFGRFTRDKNGEAEIKNNLRQERLWNMTADGIDKALIDYGSALSRKEFDWLKQRADMRKKALSAKKVVN